MAYTVMPYIVKAYIVMAGGFEELVPRHRVMKPHVNDLTRKTGVAERKVVRAVYGPPLYDFSDIDIGNAIFVNGREVQHSLTITI